MKVREQLVKLVLSFHLYLSSRDRTQVVGIAQKPLYPLSHQLPEVLITAWLHTGANPAFKEWAKGD